MNIIDKNFFALVKEIKSKSEKELYYQIRKNFDNVKEEIKISCMNFFNQYNFWGTLDIEQNNYEEIELKQITLKNHIDDFVWLYNNLEDYRSKKTLYSILNNWYCYDFETTKETRENLYDDYFDLDIVKCDKEEVIVDLGAYTGDTVLSYIKNYGVDSYKKIYCYEITKETFNILKNNLSKYKNICFCFKGISDSEEKLSLKENKYSNSANTLIKDSSNNIIVTTLDKDIKEKITLIKADIEGYEKKALKGALKHIKEDHPKLLISVYHSNEDLYLIPKMIKEISNEYKLYLRYKGSPIYPTEITLIAL